MKLGHVLQVVIILAVIALVYESHHKALFATQQLTQFKDEESLLLLHLQKIEQQSIQLHENLGRLARVGIGGGNNAAGANNHQNGDAHGGDELAAAASGGGAIDGGVTKNVDFDLIHKQTQQLYQMEEELSHEVKTLQTRIQLSARNHIIQEFGEGPVQVVLELDFGDPMANAKSNRISILLWHDTPHAAWTWLEQIGDNVWDGAEFKWQKGNIIDAVVPAHNKHNRVVGDHREKDGTIEFVEQSQHAHQAWTVGVRDNAHANSGGASGGGGASGASMGMYINLQDNSELHKHETCVGKVIDGFDALQKLLEAARNNGSSEQQQDNNNNINASSNIVIRKATAMHYVNKKAGVR